ncbi:C40 family peptidase [Saccharothrix variisporea]|nr:C40 family peptidase [Saccharothrix variisporea]
MTRLLLALAMVLGAIGLDLAAVPTASAAPACGVLADGAAQEAQDAVARACDQIGTPYSWGGGHAGQPGPSYGLCDPANGAPNDCHVLGLDCSGFVRYAYYLAVDQDIMNGITTTQWQSSRVVDRFTAAEGYDPLLPGDLLFYGSNLHHVAMYLGGGYIVEAPYSGASVRVAPTSTHSDYYGAIRLYHGGTSSRPVPGAHRIAYSEGGDLWAKDGELGAEAEFQESDVKEFQLEDERVGVLTDAGALLVKDGDLGPGWHTVDADSVTAFELDGDRIAYAEGEDLYVTEGELGSEAVLQDAPAAKFQIEGDRVGVLTPDGTLKVKAGDLGPGWTDIATGVTSFQLHGTRIAYTEGGDLWAQEGDLDEPSEFQEHDVVEYQLSGDRLAARTSSGALLVKEGDLGPGWYTVNTDSVTSFQLDGMRIAFTEGGDLWVREGDLDAPQQLLTGGVTRFQIDGDRVAVLLGDDLEVKEGALQADWFPVDPDSVTDFQIGADRNRPVRV